MKRSLIGAVAALGLFAGSAMAGPAKAKASDKDLYVGGNAVTGEELFNGDYGCGGCHGATGGMTSSDLYPRLAGQSSVYIYQQLKALQSGVRNLNAMEDDGLKKLTDQDMRDIGAYLATQATPTGTADASLAVLGQSIYFSGNPETNVPACSACHGPLGRGNAAAGYPAIAGQNEKYLSSQLEQYQEGIRYTKAGEDLAQKVPLAQLMVDVTANMTPAEIQAVSSYMQGLYAPVK